MSETKLAGPTLFSRGDTVHVNQHGTPVCKERSTSIRYLAAEAAKRESLASAGKAPEWTREQLIAVDRERHAWLMSNRDCASGKAIFGMMPG